MSTQTQQATERVELEVTEIQGEGWRVRLAEGAPDNPFALLGFVFREDGLYEVTRLGALNVHRRYDFFQEALDSLRPASREVAAILAGVAPRARRRLPSWAFRGRRASSAAA